MNKDKSNKEPLIHIVKRDNIKVWQKITFYAVSIVLALLIASVFCVLTGREKNPFVMFSSIFDGVFGTERRIWIFVRDSALLLGVSMALVPTFKMKFWNLGANGQVLVGCLASTAIMFYFGGKVSNAVSIMLMVVVSVLAGIIWALIPAIFKAFFKTNESLFTLMMNYIAEGLVVLVITIWCPTGSGTLEPISVGCLPDIGNQYLLTIIVVAIISAFMYFYLKNSKHGYELAVVGESENTAKYAGIKVEKVVIRTLILSGALCGIVGLLLSGSINHTVSKDIVNNMGFTAIMTTWLAKFNPIVMIGTSFLILFISQGMGQVRKDFGFYNDAIGNIVLGFVYFFIIGCDFFITYKIVFRKKNKGGKQ